MPTKRATVQATEREEEPTILRAVNNPANRINPRRPVMRPHQADPLTGNYLPVAPANLSQNPRGGF